MSLGNLDQTAQRVLASAGPYPVQAYEFVRDGLGHTVRRVHSGGLERGPAGGAAAVPEAVPDAAPAPRRHVNGQQLCLGLREFAIERFGVMAPAVFAHWHIHRTDDFGRMVFAMIEAGLMSKTAEDSLDDFRGVYDFDEAFCRDSLLAGIGVRDAGPRPATQRLGAP